jgi:hypothetical protein
MLRKCTSCGTEAYTEEDLENFETCKEHLHGKRNKCLPCKRESERVYRKENPEKAYNKRMKHHCLNTYGITLEEYKKRMSTSSSCEICSSTENLSYDHNHDTEDFRGVLCNKCNRSIGQLGDTLEDMIKVVRYLSKPFK